MSDESPFVSVTWIAAVAGVSATSVKRWIAKDGGLKIHRVNGRCAMALREEAVAWLETRNP